jgi:starch synthase
MDIVQIASEFAPIAKVGGLGDVVYGLTRELERQGHTVSVILPKYDTLPYGELKGLKPLDRDLWSFDGPYPVHNAVWEAYYEGTHLLLLEPHHVQYPFSRGKIYGCTDDIDRFIYFSRAALEYLFKTGRRPDVIHCHDWPTALVPALYREIYVPLGMKVGKTVLTLHNVEHQGKCSPENLSRSGLRGVDFLTPEKMQDDKVPALINLLKGGVVYSDCVTTVSPTYEKEIQSAPLGFGLETTFVKHRAKLRGILNGIDLLFWDPMRDPWVTRSESQGKWKQVNRKALEGKLSLPETKGPLVVAITRLTPQKGPALIAEAILYTLERGGSFVLLGSSVDPATRAEFASIEKMAASHPQVHLHFSYDEPLAHLAYAAADMIVIPSLYEPCGLTQMIALRYGTVPIVRATGGLADTIVEGRNGFTFAGAERGDLRTALDRAFSLYTSHPRKWKELTQRGMACDFSWKRPVGEYLEVYSHPCLRQE